MSSFSGISSFIATIKHTTSCVPSTEDRVLVVAGRRLTNPTDGSIEIETVHRAKAAVSREGHRRLISRSRMEDLPANDSDSPWSAQVQGQKSESRIQGRFCKILFSRHFVAMRHRCHYLRHAPLSLAGAIRACGRRRYLIFQTDDGGQQALIQRLSPILVYEAHYTFIFIVQTLGIYSVR
jgi:hypothetical protein